MVVAPVGSAIPLILFLVAERFGCEAPIYQVGSRFRFTPWGPEEDGVSVRSFRRSHARRVARERRRVAKVRQRALVAGAALGATAVFAANAEAATYTVTTTADNGPGTCNASECTLRDAIAAANTNGTAGTPDTIDLSGVSGTITLDSTKGAIGITDPGGLNINGPGSGTLAVSGGGQTGIFQINAGTGAPVSISGLTLTAGSSTTNGGAIDETASPLTLTNDTISGNTSTGAGGGIYSRSALTISGSTITGNTAAFLGGGIAALKYSVSISNSTISGNSAENGGGIGSEIDNVSITGSHIDNNQATSGVGGGIASVGGSLSVTDSTVSGNTSPNSDGGGIFSETKYGTTVDHATVSNNAAAYGGGLLVFGERSPTQNPVLVQDSTISGNQAPKGAGIDIAYDNGLTPVTVKASTISGNQGGSGSFGGGILLAGSLFNPFDLVDSTISGNSATDGGGVSLGYGGSTTALLGSGGSISFDNSTIDRNTAASDGGGIYLAQYDTGSGNQSAMAAINSTIVAGDTAGGAPNDLFRPTTSTSGGFNDSFSLIQNPGNAPLLSSEALITGVDPQLGPLANIGGPTQTMLPSNASPVIDQGRAQAGLTTDQRGHPRTVNNGKPEPPGGDGTDIGAVELPLIPPPPPPPPPSPPPSPGIAATIGPATGITTASAVLHGTITTNGLAVTWHFEYGRNTNYGQTTPSEAISSGHGNVPVSFDIDHLKPGTLYHYRLVGVSSSGKTATSRDATFKTPALRASTVTAVLHAAPLRRGCAVETGRDELEITALGADATCRHLRLTLHGTIQTGGKLARSASGTIRVSFTVTLPDGRATGSARTGVNHGRWRTSLVAPGINLDPLPPRYLITIRYSGDHALQPASTSRRIRLESERAGLSP
jgi:CSLREA domain-containing protein